MTEFKDFGLAEPILRALTAEGYTQPTPIQEQAIPLLLEGRDLLGIAQTGTGKTLAFAAPLLNHLRAVHKPRPMKGARVLVLAPTRELAGQIEASFKTYGHFLDVGVTSVYGGVKINKQIRRLEKGVDVLVATPGRLIDLVEQRALTLRDVEILVLDEADQMLDLGFIHALKQIVPMLPKERQTLFFSATMPTSIAQLAGKFLNNPVKVSVAPESTTAERVKQSVMFVSHGQKQALLKFFVQQEVVERALVFTRTKHGADRVVRKLLGGGIQAMAIHGNKSQPQRQRALDAFKNGDCNVLIATEVAARGIDIDALSHVINYDVPNVPEQYVHRIGRTGRAGAEGIAVSFVADDERVYLRDIERLIKQKIPIEPISKSVNLAEPQPMADGPPERDRERSHPAQRRGGGPGRGMGGRPGGRGPARGAKDGAGKPSASRFEPRSGVKPAGRFGEGAAERPSRDGETGERSYAKKNHRGGGKPSASGERDARGERPWRDGPREDRGGGERRSAAPAGRINSRSGEKPPARPGAKPGGKPGGFKASGGKPDGKPGGRGPGGKPDGAGKGPRRPSNGGKRGASRNVRRTEPA